MKTICIKFQSEGKTVKKSAVLTNDLSELSESRKNQAYDIDFGLSNDGTWSLLFEADNGGLYEAVFAYDRENEQQTLVPEVAITWNEDGVILDEQSFSVSVK